MAKATIQFVCQQCGATQSKWSGKCDQCGQWNSLVETTVAPRRASTGAVAAKPQKISEVETKKLPRIDSGIGEVNQVLGGGIIPC